MSAKRWLAAALPLALALGWLAQAQDARPDPGPAAIAGPRPFLEAHCLRCHAGAEAPGGLDLSGFETREQALARPGPWARVAERLAIGDMPPPSEAEETGIPGPTAAEREAFLGYARALVREGRERLAADPGRVTLRRLNRAEYNHSVQDLFGLALSPADAFPDDDVGYGYDTVGDVLSLPPLTLERALSAAEAVAQAACRDFEPLARTFSADELSRDGRGSTRGGVAWLVTNGEMACELEVAWPGRYRVVAEVIAQQAGPEKARYAIRLDGRNAAVIRTRREDKERAERILELPAGRRRIALAFLNDFWDEDAADPKQRDRNLGIVSLRLEGPLDAPAPTLLERRLAAHHDPASPREAWPGEARGLLGEVARRAWRRPLREGELDRIGAIFEAELGRSGRFALGVQAALTYILVSPHFLYRVELHPAPEDPEAAHPIGDYELATRLSYSLWASTPDDALLALAGSGGLREALPELVERMIDDPRSSRFVEAFAGQWLQLRQLSIAAPDPELFPDFDEPLREALRIESEMLLEALLREGRPLAELLDADFTFVNGRLARFYGLPAPRGPRWRRIRAPEGRRGILGHAGILTLSSNPTRASPVKRGKWVLEVLLDDPPPPPLPGSDSLSPIAEAAAREMTLRQRFELHRANKDCAVCHDRLDPLGFALEGYDAIGRLAPKAEALDLSGMLPSGERFTGPEGLREVLRRRLDKVARGFVRNLFVYMIGRGTTEGDEAVIAAIVAEAGPQLRLRDLVRGLLLSRPFREGRGERPPAAAPERF